MKPVSEPTLEAIAVEKRHEKLQISLFPVLWSGGHQEEMTGNSRKQLAQLLALGFLYLPAKE